jgi:hypothetical protein
MNAARARFWTMVAWLALTAGLATQAYGAQVLLLARDVRRLSEFYGAGLGLPVVAPDGDGGRVVFDAGGTELILVPSRSGEEGGSVRLLIPAADLEAARARLDTMRVPYQEVWGPDSTALGFFFQDPERNLVGYVLDSAPRETWLVPLTVAREPRASERSGRVRLMVYGGTYGIWSGIALPAGLGSESPTVYGLSIMAAGPLGVYAAHRFDRAKHVTRGRADVISLAGNFGTGQALGWAAISGSNGDGDARDVVLIGAGAGLASIVAAGLITEHAQVSEGQATLLHSATYWGTWYGLLASLIADTEGSGEAMLGGAAAGLAGGIVWCLDHDTQASRVNLVSLSGLLGTAFGFGLDLLVHSEDQSTVFAIPAITGLAGLGAGIAWTRDRSGNDVGEAITLEPPMIYADAGRRGGYRVALLVASF